MIFIIAILLSFSSFAFTQEELGKRLHFSVGVDLFQIQNKEQRYKFDNTSSIKSPLDNTMSRVAWNLSYRVTKEYPLYIGVRTNRGINFPTTQYAFDTIANQKVQVDIKSQADSLYVATAVHSKVIPFIIATKLQSSADIIYRNGYSFNNKTTSIMYGVGIGTPLWNKGTISFTYYLPNAKFNTVRMFGLSVNYFII